MESRLSAGIATGGLLWALGGLSSSAAPLSGAPETLRQIDPICALQTDRYRVQLVKEGRCCPNPMELLFEDRQTREKRSIPFAARVGKSANLRLIDDRTLLITGTLEPGAKSLLLVDLEAGRLRDEILTFDYRLSPSKQRLVYSRYAPPETPAEDRSTLLLFYDLTRSAAANRAGRPASYDASNAGLPIFPAANAERGSYDPLSSERHRLLSPILWSQDEARVVFFAEHAGAHALVAVDLSSRESPRIARKPMHLDDLLSDPPSRRPAADARPVVTLRWQDPETVLLEAVLGVAVQDAVAVTVP